MDKPIKRNAQRTEEPWPVGTMAGGRTTILPRALALVPAPPTPAIATETVPDLIVDRPPSEEIAPLYKVLIHNDDVTPLDYVIRILCRVFTLSQELAEHIAETAHSEEVAIVVIRPRSEAEKLMGAARLQARADGFPLTFSMEPDE